MIGRILGRGGFVRRSKTSGCGVRRAAQWWAARSGFAAPPNRRMCTLGLMCNSLATYILLNYFTASRNDALAA